jgi:sentrin-specific protease 1
LLYNELLKYICCEAFSKKGERVDKKKWDFEVVDAPKQHNGHDCGVFSLMAARYASSNLPLTYSQHDMPTMRYIIMLHIFNGIIPRYCLILFHTKK